MWKNWEGNVHFEKICVESFIPCVYLLKLACSEIVIFMPDKINVDWNKNLPHLPTSFSPPPGKKTTTNTLQELIHMK